MFLDFESLTEKNRQNECDKIKFINNKNQTHQSQTSKTEALQVNNFQKILFREHSHMTSDVWEYF